MTKLAWFLWWATILIDMFGTYFASAHIGKYNGMFYTVGPSIEINAMAFFVIVKNYSSYLQEKISGTDRNILLAFAKASFGIYLIHPIMIRFANRGLMGWKLYPEMEPQPLMILVTALAVYLISFAFVRCIPRIPYLRRML